MQQPTSRLCRQAQISSPYSTPFHAPWDTGASGVPEIEDVEEIEAPENWKITKNRLLFWKKVPKNNLFQTETTFKKTFLTEVAIEKRSYHAWETAAPQDTS